MVFSESEKNVCIALIIYTLLFPSHKNLPLSLQFFFFFAKKVILPFKKKNAIILHIHNIAKTLFSAFLFCVVYIISFLLHVHVTRNKIYQKLTNLHQFRFVQEDKRVCWPKPQTKHPILILIHPL